jgi:hypothetical protein
MIIHLLGCRTAARLNSTATTNGTSDLLYINSGVTNGESSRVDKAHIVYIMSLYSRRHAECEMKTVRKGCMTHSMISATQQVLYR